MNSFKEKIYGEAENFLDVPMVLPFLETMAGADFMECSKGYIRILALSKESHEQFEKLNQDERILLIYKLFEDIQGEDYHKTDLNLIRSTFEIILTANKTKPTERVEIFVNYF